MLKPPIPSGSIALNVLRDHWRGAGQAVRGARLLEELELESLPAPAPPDDARRTDTLRARVERTLLALNDRYRTALVTRFVEGRGAHESAAALGVRRATFDVILHRACQAFRKLYGNPREEP